MLKFADGMHIETDGELRTLKLSDGWYVVGKGMLIPVRDKQEALDYIQEHKKKDDK
jgi:hypothetical protein